MMLDTSQMLGLETAIKERRAARSFSSEPIPAATLSEIFRLSFYSPSGYNLQPWRFIVVRDAANRERLQECAFGQRQVGEAPVVLICCGDRRVTQPDYIESIIQLGRETDSMNDSYADNLRSSIPATFENQPSFGSLEVWTNRHTMLAVAHLMIVAKSLGVDTCPMEGFSAAQVKEAFGIPDAVDVCCLLPMGYAKEPTKAFGGRFGIDTVCFGERFDEPFQVL